MNWFLPSLRYSVILALTSILLGCSNNLFFSSDLLYKPIAISLQAKQQAQFNIARYSLVLQRGDIGDELRGKLLHERAMVYDLVGLHELARLDFNQSLRINPSNADILNSLGIYFIQNREFDDAFDAFDASLELDPNNMYFQRNRAIALYYAKRLELAYEDILLSYQLASQDPFNILWMYIIQAKIDPQAAKRLLRKNYTEHQDNSWPWLLIKLMLEEASPSDLLQTVFDTSPDNETLAYLLTEAYFYIAKMYQYNGMLDEATNFYKLAISLNVYEYIEHRFSFLELFDIAKNYEQLDNN